MRIWAFCELRTNDLFNGNMLKARCMYYLGQFEKSLLVWTKADRLRKNNKEVLNLHFDSNPSSPAPCERGNGSGGGDHSHIIEVSPADLKKD